MEPQANDKNFPAAEELARAFVKAIQAKDKAAILALLTDDFILEVPFNVSGTNDLSDSWHGLDAAAANFEATWQNIDIVKYAAIEFTACQAPDIAFAETLGDMRMASGRPYRNRYVFRFDCENGRIRRIREYANPVTAMIAWGAPVDRSDKSPPPPPQA